MSGTKMHQAAKSEAFLFVGGPLAGEVRDLKASPVVYERIEPQPTCNECGNFTDNVFRYVKKLVMWGDKRKFVYVYDKHVGDQEIAELVAYTLCDLFAAGDLRVKGMRV